MHWRARLSHVVYTCALVIHVLRVARSYFHMCTLAPAAMYVCTHAGHAHAYSWTPAGTGNACALSWTGHTHAYARTWAGVCTCAHALVTRADSHASMCTCVSTCSHMHTLMLVGQKCACHVDCVAGDCWDWRSDPLSRCSSLMCKIPLS